MSKSKKSQKKKRRQEQPSLFRRIYRFFVPKDWQADVYKGMVYGQQWREGHLSPRVVPTYWVGKLLRKIIDPKHKMKIGKEE